MPELKYIPSTKPQTFSDIFYVSRVDIDNFVRMCGIFYLDNKDVTKVQYDFEQEMFVCRVQYSCEKDALMFHNCFVTFLTTSKVVQKDFS